VRPFIFLSIFVSTAALVLGVLHVRGWSALWSVLGLTLLGQGGGVGLIRVTSLHQSRPGRFARALRHGRPNIIWLATFVSLAVLTSLLIANLRSMAHADARRLINTGITPTDLVSVIVQPPL